MMADTNEMSGHFYHTEGIDSQSRREFLKSTAIVVMTGMTAGIDGFFRTANARTFAEYMKFDGLGLANLVRRKKVKPEELLDAAIARVEAVNPKINAIVTKMYDEARKTISNGLPDGPFMAFQPQHHHYWKSSDILTR
jgi:hypothetical protein